MTEERDRLPSEERFDLIEVLKAYKLVLWYIAFIGTLTLLLVLATYVTD